MKTRSGFLIRPYGEADRGVVRRMMDALQEYECTIESNRAHWGDGGATYTDWMLDQVAQNDGACFLAEAENGAVGFSAGWRVIDEEDITIVAAARSHFYVSDLFVLEAWRGRGIGGALLAAVEEHGRHLGLAQMTIGVLSVNTPARRAYAKAGFEEYEMLLRKRL